MRTLPDVINEALPGYYPEGCTTRQFAELTSERIALKMAIGRVAKAINQTKDHPSGAKLRQAIIDHGYTEVLYRSMLDYLHQDMEGFLAREMGLQVHPEFVGDVYTEYADWKEMMERIEHLDFMPAE